MVLLCQISKLNPIYSSLIAKLNVIETLICYDVYLALARI